MDARLDVVDRASAAHGLREGGDHPPDVSATRSLRALRTQAGLSAVAPTLRDRRGWVRFGTGGGWARDTGGVTATQTPQPAGVAGRVMSRLPPELLFVVSATSQNLGSATAVRLFDEVPAQVVAWVRVGIAAVVLLVISRTTRMRWNGPERKLLVAFGVVTISMNILFYFALQRLPLGKGLAIEFIGPVTVAALRTRTRRNAVALALAVSGVGILSGVELDAEPLGVLLILLASAGWAGHVVLGSSLAKLGRGAEALGSGLACGALAVTPWALATSGALWHSPILIARCALVGLFSSVIGYSIDQHVLRRVSVRRFAVFLAIIPVVAVLIGILVLSQDPTLVDLVGIGLVIAAVATQDRS